VTREEVFGALCQAFYETSDDFDPSMPQLWQRGFMTRSPVESAVERIVEKCAPLAAWLDSLPTEQSQESGRDK